MVSVANAGLRKGEPNLAAGGTGRLSCRLLLDACLVMEAFDALVGPAGTELDSVVLQRHVMFVRYIRLCGERECCCAGRLTTSATLWCLAMLR